MLRRESGLGRGFDLYDDDVEPIGKTAVIGRVQRQGPETVRVAKNWVDRQSGPFFLFLHLYDPHTPYDPPEPFLSRYADRYDGEIAFTDQTVGDFVAYLKQRDLYDKSLIIFVSDHGEGLSDHREEEHGIFLYREALQVPLLVKMPRGRHGGKTVDDPVGLTDIYQTVVEQTATPQHSAKSEALSLLSVLKEPAKRAIYSETFYPKQHFGWSDLHSLIDGDNHFIRAPMPELYDLKADPAEKTNVMQENRRAFVRMRDAIEPFVRAASAPARIDPEEASKLAALGYIGSAVNTDPGEKLADPKSTIEIFNQIRLAYTYFKEEKNEQALALTNKLLADNGRITDLWDLKSQLLNRLGRREESIAAAKAGLKQAPNAVALMFAIANLSLLTNDLDQAQQHAELGIRLEPGRAHEILSRVWIQRGNLDRARQEAKLAIAASHDSTSALMALALIEKQSGNLSAAMQTLDQAATVVSQKKNKRVPNLHLYRGDVLARLNRTAEAEREFRQEIEFFPDQPDAYSSLILLLSAQRRIDEATGLVFSLVKAAPNARSYIAISETLKAIGDDRGAVYWAVQGLEKFPDNGELRKLLRVARQG